ncbi:MAG: radical SAM protein, partial [Deltaproteobacteria bacterium]|nr:radical SAM protein [Deltaproteobacteria bacterium]
DQTGDAHTLVLTGGEPTMRRDLTDLVRYAKGRGTRRVILETNAALIDVAGAEALADAGLDVARVHLPAWGEACDAITRDPGGFTRALGGAAAFAAAGVRIEAAAPVVRSNREELLGLPGALVESDLPFACLRLCAPTEAPDGRELLSLSEMAAVISKVEAACRRADLPVHLSPDSLVPPCFFARPARVSHLFALTPGGAERPAYRRVASCTACTVADRCPGVPVAALGVGPEPDKDEALPMTPITEDRVRRRLSIISSVEEQIARELVQEDIYRRPGGETLPAGIVRINFRCNQACHFCFVSTHLPTADDAAIRRAITEISGRGGVLVISGGEPTLNPQLLDYVKLGKEEGAREIEIQTNAVRLRDPEFGRALVAAGVDQFFVSLHGSRAQISDVVTQAPGTFDQTVLGLDTLVALDARVLINFVFCEMNKDDFADYVALVAGRWPGAQVVVSFVAPSTDVVPRTRALIPRYSDILPSLARGLRVANELDVTVTGFESMCGVPLCLVPEELSRSTDLATIPEGFDRGEFVATDACQRCDLLGRCFGLRRGYFELFGSDELQPFTAEG